MFQVCCHTSLLCLAQAWFKKHVNMLRVPASRLTTRLLSFVRVYVHVGAWVLGCVLRLTGMPGSKEGEEDAAL